MCHRPAAGHVQVDIIAMLAELPKLSVSQMARAWELFYVYSSLATQLMA